MSRSTKPRELYIFRGRGPRPFARGDQESDRTPAQPGAQQRDRRLGIAVALDETGGEARRGNEGCEGGSMRRDAARRRVPESRAQAATEFHLHPDRRDRLHHREILRLTCKGSVEVHNVDPRTAGSAKLRGHVGRIRRIHGLLVGTPLEQPHSAATFDVDGGINGHSKKRFAPGHQGARLKPMSTYQVPVFLSELLHARSPSGYEAEAQAVETSSETERPVARMLALRLATSAVSMVE